jgi:hypothetical protein
LPTALDAICTRALDPDPAKRYQTAAEFEAELEGVLVGAADSHSRNLGKVVSLAFEAERAERQAVIERSLRGEGPLPARMTPTTPIPVMSVTSVTTLTPVTRVTAPMSLQTQGATVELPGVDITVGDLRVESPNSFVKLPSKAPNALRWWRGVALASLAVTSFAVVLMLGYWRRAPMAAPPTSNAAVTTVAPPTWLSDPPVGKNVAAKPATRRAPPASSRAVVAADGARDASERHRRHRRVETSDEDATLPPSNVDSEP